MMLRSVDELLGPAAERYFGGRFLDERMTLQLDTPTSGAVTIAYPRDWSSKGGRSTARPHFSTLDALALVGRFVEHGSARVSLRAPTQLVEELEDMPLSIESADQQLRLKCQGMAVVADSMKLRANPVQGTLPLADERYELSDIELGDDVSTAVSARYRRSNVVAATAAFAQLVQVMLYRADGVRRADSKVLIMRQLRVDVAAGDAMDESLEPSFAGYAAHGTRSRVHESVSARLVDRQHIDMSDRTFSTAEFEGSLGRYSFATHVAHELAEGARP